MNKEKNNELDNFNKELNKLRPNLRECKENKDEITCNSVEWCQWEENSEENNQCQLVEYFGDNNVKSRKTYKIKSKSNIDFVCLSMILSIGLLIIVFCRKKKWLH